MKLRDVNPDQVAWETAARILSRQTHEPLEMRSGQSRGPILMWVCDVCSTHRHSTTSLAPVCRG